MGTADADSRILVGVDGSEDGLRAVLYAMREARARGGSLWLVHVVDLRSMSTGLWGLVADQQDLERAGQAALQDARDLLAREDFPVERVHSEVVLGDPLLELPRLSARARLAVMGRRAISGLERMFVGSTSVALVTNGQCPPIVISSASTPRETGRLRVVAVAVNAWPPHGSALEWGLGRRGCVRRGCEWSTCSLRAIAPKLGNSPPPPRNWTRSWRPCVPGTLTWRSRPKW